MSKLRRAVRHTSRVTRHPKSAGRPDPVLISDLVAANRILAREGVLDGWGHVSVRHNLDPNRFLLSRSLAPERVIALTEPEWQVLRRGIAAGDFETI